MAMRIGLTIAAVAAAGLLWIGGELHYRSCVDAAEAANPIKESEGLLGGFEGIRARREAIDDCSRLPL